MTDPLGAEGRCDKCGISPGIVGPIRLLLQAPPSAWLCRECWQREMVWRRERNRKSVDEPYPVTEWPEK